MYEPHGTDSGFVHKRLLGAVGGFLTGGPLGAIGGFASGGGSSPGPRTLPRGCPTGLEMIAGRCVRVATTNLGLSGRGEGFGAPRSQVPTPGFGGFVERLLPGGASGFQPGGAVMGQWGAALEPEVVGQVTRIDGSVGPLLRCIRGMFLGTDDLCYNKPLANNKRKWPRPTPPFLSGGDVKCLRRSIRLRKSKSSKKLLRELGMG